MSPHLWANSLELYSSGGLPKTPFGTSTLSPPRKAHFQKQNREGNHQRLHLQEPGAGMSCLFLSECE